MNMINQLETFMVVALEEARQSLKDGNCGFGAVVARNGEVIAKAHDTEKTKGDPTAHAEITAVKMAADHLGRDLSGCIVVSTHEPCPMCSTAILWAGIDKIGYGFSIREAIQQGRRRIDLPCKEIFDRAGKPVSIFEDIMHSECSILYNKQVRDCIDQLRDADESRLQTLSYQLAQKRLAWFTTHKDKINLTEGTAIDKAYHVFLSKLDLTPNEAPISKHTSRGIVIHSLNFCPTLEACMILGLDTRRICAQLTEIPTDILLKQVNPRLRFSRNYTNIRPYSEYCEEIICLEEIEEESRNNRLHRRGYPRRTQAPRR